MLIINNIPNIDLYFLVCMSFYTNLRLDYNKKKSKYKFKRIISDKTINPT